MNLTLNDQAFLPGGGGGGGGELVTTDLYFQVDASTSDHIWKDDAMTINCADGELCYRISNAQGGLADFGQGTSGDRATWRANSINGLGALEFRQDSPGGKSYISDDSTIVMNDVTWFAVIRFVSSPVRNTDWQTIAGFHAENRMEWQMIRPSDGTDGRKLAAVKQAVVEIGKSNSKVTFDTTYLLMVQYSDITGEWLHERNGVADGSGTNVQDLNDTGWFMRIGNQQSSGVQSQWMHADLGELLLYNAVLSAADVDSTAGYLLNKWGL